MSPVGGKGQNNMRTTLLVAVAAVAAAAGLLVLVVVLADDGRVELRLGSDRFDAGRASSKLSQIKEDGPILFPDVGTGTRDVYLQNLGDDAEEGWLAFDARQLDQPRSCNVEWDRDDSVFVDPCDGKTFPADGAGLRAYSTSVEMGHVFVDFAPRKP